MPFKSKAQMKFLSAKKPKVAAKFAADTPKGLKLPKTANPAKALKVKTANPLSKLKSKVK